MNTIKSFSSLILVIFCFVIQVQSSDITSWNLDRCITYALENNIQIRQIQLDSLSAVSSLKQARAQQLPGLSASARYQASQQRYFDSEVKSTDPGQSFRYSISADWTAFAGTGIRTQILKSIQELESLRLNAARKKCDIIIAVLDAYLEVLYAQENLKNAVQTMQTSEKQYQRTKHLCDAGAASPVDVAGMRSQYAADSYSMTIAQNNLDMKILSLKQLLEIPLEESFELFFPSVDELSTNIELPPEDTFIKNALDAMPDMAMAENDITIARLNLQKAKSAYLPELTVSAGITASQDVGNTVDISGRTSNSYSPSVGAQLNLPIYDKRQTKTSVEQASIGLDAAKLKLEATRKSLIKSAETVYINARGAKKRLIAAQLQLEASKKSFDLAQEQYNLGLIHVVDLQTQRDVWLSAQNEYIQAKFSVLLYAGAVNLYQGQPVTIF